MITLLIYLDQSWNILWKCAQKYIYILIDDITFMQKNFFFIIFSVYLVSLQKDKKVI